MSLRESLRARGPVRSPARPSSPQPRRAGRADRGALAAGASFLAVALWGLAVQAAEFERTFSYPADRLTVTTLVGEVRVEKGTGSEIQVTVHVRGQDADEKWIRFDSDTGSSPRLTIQFPLDEHRKYVYPGLGRSSRTSFTPRDGRHSGDNWLEDLLDRSSGDRIEVRGQPWSDALELWTEVVVRVPDSRDATVNLGAGRIEALDVQADLELRSRSGPVKAAGITGDLVADTGSGAVRVERVRGEVLIDTGSGGVELHEVSGARSVHVDTGSGSVDVSGIEAGDLLIDTGSGGVDLADIDVKSLVVDTGSGGVDGEEIATDEARIDTGSGGVALDLVRMGHGPYDIDTGSGGIRLGLPEEISAEFDAETGSGSIVADIDGVSLGRRNRHEARFTVGGGDAQVTLSTGSGSIRLSQGGSSVGRR